MPTSCSSKSKKRRYPGLSDDLDQQHTKKETADVDKKTSALSITLDLVLEASQLHNGTSSGGKNDRQPWAKFDDNTQYDVTEEQETALWKLEFDRLLRACRNEALLTFEGHNVLDQEEAPYKALSDMADQLLIKMTVMMNDTEVLALEYMPDYFDHNRYRRSRRHLEYRLSVDEPQRNPRRLKDRNAQVYYALVDYATATVARLITRSITIDSFHTKCIMVLGKISTKLKVLCADPVRYAETSLALGEETERRIDITSTIRDAQFMWDEEAGNDRGMGATRMKSMGRFEPEEDVNRRIYHMANLTLRAFLMDILNYVLVEIHGARKSRVGTEKDTVENFNMTSLVYETGFSSHPTLVSQDRFGEFSAASALDTLRPCYTAFRILVDTTQHLGDDESETRNFATFDWRWEDMDENLQQKIRRQRKRITRMDNVVTIMVPLLCTEPQLCYMVSVLTNISTSMEDQPMKDVPEAKFIAFYNLKTSTDDKPHQNVLESTLPLASSSLVHSGRYMEERTARTLAQTESKQHAWRIRGKIMDRGTQFERNSRQSLQSLDTRINREWVIDDDSITIQCEGYVLSVLTLCFILVSGGFAMGLTVGERIRGVDPFGITTFCWTLAALILLVSKSVYVANWPWRDFLLRRCVCRSVSELASITGIDAQDVITYLLHNEDNHILSVRGPYNKPFAGQGNWGFSIDVKPTLRTLHQSGIIMIMVATDNGPALVGLNVRRSKQLVWIDHSHRDGEEENTLACVDVSQSSHANQKTAGLKLQRLSMSWYRAYGVYDSPWSEFR